MPREEIAFTARLKIYSHSQIFRYGRGIFFLLQSTSVQFFRFFWFMPSLGVRSLLVKTTIGDDSFARAPRINVVWKPWFVMERCVLFNSLLVSDVDSANVVWRLPVMCRGQFILFLAKVNISRCYHYIAAYYIICVPKYGVGAMAHQGPGGIFFVQKIAGRVDITNFDLNGLGTSIWFPYNL